MVLREALDNLPPAPRAWSRARRARTAGRPQRKHPLQAALSQPVWTRSPKAEDGLRCGRPTFAGLLAPADIERCGRGMIRAGDSYIVTLEARVWPVQLELGWLHAPLLDLDAPGITIHQRIVPLPDSWARRLLTDSENAARGTLASDADVGVAEDIDAALGLQAAAALRAEVAAGTDRLFQITLTISVAGASPEETAARVAALRSAAAQTGLGLSIANDLQWEGYQALLPLGRMPGMLAHDWSGRAVAQGLPSGPGGLVARGEQPLVWGEHPRTGAPILWDRWSAVNPHGLVIAESGNGKTYAMSGYIAQEVALGDVAVLILDPKHHEYRPLVQALGGAYISLARNAPYHINPLELPLLSPERSRVVQELDLDLLGERVGFARALIVAAFRANHTAVDVNGIVLLEAALYAAYAACGITADPGTFTRRMPTFTDVQAALEVLADTETDAEVQGRARRLARGMRLFTSGTLGALFNAPSNIPTANPLLALDLHALLSADDDVLRQIIPVVVADFFKTTALNRPTGRRYHLVLDEAHALLHSEAGARTLDVVFRVGRALGFAATVITQSLDDLDESPQTRTLIDNAPTKLILGLNRDSNAVDRAAALLHLNAAEYEYLAQCRLQKGVGAWALLLADGQRAPLFIPQWPATLHEVVTGQRERAEAAA